MKIDNFKISTLAMLLLFTCANVRATDVVYVANSGHSSLTQEQLKAAADFYGLDEKVFVAGPQGADAKIAKNIQDSSTVGAVIAADALPFLNRQQILTALRRSDDASIPLLIIGIDDRTDANQLKAWSGGAIIGFGKSTAENGFFRIHPVNGLTYELGGNALPLKQSHVGYLSQRGPGTEPIMTAVIGTSELPVFSLVSAGSDHLFFAVQGGTDETPIGVSPYREVGVFTSLAAEMIFMRFAGGPRAWHPPGSYANFTIDDAWLQQSYGFVDYQALLREMEQHNFHTTIAFVPWNFDRSEAGVVSLFLRHADRLSICVHGNNHDHQEFAAYGSKPLAGQENDIRQGLARMAKFRELTGVPYDSVMVFPHSISPEPTLALLKRYNFLGTANSLNVPFGEDAPPDSEFALRTMTLAFENFPSLRRYSAEAPGPTSQLVVDAFLGNPMLFYAHQGFFAQGIDAFDSTADIVNHLQPKTQWRSLGDIMQHLYLERLRADGNYDIRTYSRTIEIHNDENRDRTFFVQKKEDFALPVTVLLDGQVYPYQREGTTLTLQVPIGGGLTRRIEVVYTNDLDIAKTDISKSSLRIQAIRRLSDFRDDVVSKTASGRWFIRSYSENGDVWNRSIGGAFALILVIAACSYWRGTRRPKKIRSSPAPRIGTRVES